MNSALHHSIIIPYRNRLEHLEILVPRLREVLNKLDYSIIVVEQADNKIFRRGNLKNCGAVYSRDGILIFHDVDHYPLDNVLYYDNQSDVYLPVNKVNYVMNDLSPREITDIPSGYRHFKDGVDSSFFGGVVTITKEAFTRINGYGSNFKGWGIEDGNLGIRAKNANLSITRGNGSFLALHHEDSFPGERDPDFINNAQRANDMADGLNNMTFKLNPVHPKISGVDHWLECSDFDPPIAHSNKITVSQFNFEEEVI